MILFIIFVCIVTFILYPPMLLLLLPILVAIVFAIAKGNTELDEHGCVRHGDSGKHGWDR